MSILVTGGAGYIGAHLVDLLSDDVPCVVVDDLSTGHASRTGTAPLVEVDLAASKAVEVLTGLMHDYSVSAVVHFAARKQVGESTERPAWYYSQNVGGMANLLLAMEAAGVSDLVFSSSAATYGATPVNQDGLIDEDAPPRPISPYGETKLICEWMCRDAERAWGLRWAGLRYFNVAGADRPDLGDPAVLNLIPLVFRALARGRQPVVFGDDYDTPDGTCIRDYVHVRDLAEAHSSALSWLRGADYGSSDHRIFNVGTGVGASVADVLATVAEVTGLEVRPVIEGRRPGDPPQLVADVRRIRNELGWASGQGLTSIVQSAWDAWQDPARSSGERGSETLRR